MSLCAVPARIAAQLAKFPSAARWAYRSSQHDTTSIDDYPSELRQYMMRVPEDDMEQQMEALRQFKLSQQQNRRRRCHWGFTRDCERSLNLLAEAITEQVVMQAWQQVSVRHGVPAHLSGQ